MFLALLLITFPCIKQAIAKAHNKPTSTPPWEGPTERQAGKKNKKASFETVITSVNIKINKAFTCLVQKKKAAKQQNKTLK